MAGRESKKPAFTAYPRQREAIEHVRGPILLVAGAGTGKTAVLIQRIAHLIRAGHAKPHEILAVTYTENAAREMRERVAAELQGTDLNGLQACTFHAYCFNLLIRNDRQFGVLDDNDLYVYLRQHIRELGLKYFVRAANVGKFLKDLLDFMRRCQDELVTPKKYAEYVERVEHGELRIHRVTSSKHSDELTDEEVLGRCREIAAVFATVEKMLREKNLGTFGHMITRALELVETDAGVLAAEQKRARFLLVDEFQDANFAQIRLLNRLAGEDRNVFAVGDPDQAIYRFRGASTAAFDIFLRHFPGAKVVRLDKNRRSTRPILQCAHALIDENPPILAAGPDGYSSARRTPLEAAREEEAQQQGTPLKSAPVEVILGTKELEAADVASTLQDSKKELRCAWSDFAILYRSHLHRTELVEELIAQGVPFIIEDMDVMDTPPVRDLVACMGAVVSPSDSTSLFRVAALPQFAMDPQELRAVMKSVKRGTSLASVLPKVEGGTRVLERLQTVRAEVQSEETKALQALQLIARGFELDADSPAVQAVFDFVRNWQEKPIISSGHLAELLEYLKYFGEAGGTINVKTSLSADAVRLMTAHAAKGLEFQHVFILRANSGAFPTSYKEPLVEFPAELRDKDSAAAGEGKQLNEEEERRLFYVAMTRARDSLRIYAKPGVGKDHTPPGFVRPLLKKRNLKPYLIEREARPMQVDLFGGSAQVEAAGAAVTAWLELPPPEGLHTSLSATAIQTYETCPLKFKLDREWKIPGEIPAATQYGAAMHLALRHYYDGVRFGRPASAAEVIAVFQEEFAKAVIEDPYQRELYERQGVGQLTDFVAAAERSGFPEVLHTEQVFELRIGSTTVNGRIDRIDRVNGEQVAIVDYKTGKPQSQDDADKSLQLSIYALAAREKWGYRAERLMFHNLEDNSPVVTRRGEFDLREARERVEEVAENIRAGKFEPASGFHCNWCGYRTLCPATEKRWYMPAPTAMKPRGG
jgi:DNA helicase-2/ATP-dependent DNA helicase PcrA